jgi:hypothetical protein
MTPDELRQHINQHYAELSPLLAPLFDVVEAAREQAATNRYASTKALEEALAVLDEVVSPGHEV